MSLKQLLKSRKPLIALSPMDGITDEVYRQIQISVKKPDLLFTEFVSAEGISRGGVKLYDQLLFQSNERPIVGQLFGKDPESFYKSAIILSYLGFDGIDINMGCPAKTVTQHGSGAALIEKPQLASDIINSVKKGVSDYLSGKVTIDDLDLKKASLDIIQRNLRFSNYKPTLKIDPTISVKTRLGINTPVIDTWIPFLLKHDLDFLTLHGRTLKQAYSGQADWQLISLASDMARKSHTHFFGNGDITSLSQALEYIEKYHLKGVHIGRASMGNPWIFGTEIPSLKQKFSTMLFHAQLFRDIFPQRRFDSLRKHFLLYTTGHPRAKQLRAQLVRITDIQGLLDLEEDYLS